MMIVRLLLAGCLICSIHLARAQEAAVLTQRIAELSTPNAVMAEVDAMYNGRERIEEGPKYKHWARWAWRWSRLVQSDGTFGYPRKQIISAMRDLPQLESNNRNNNNWNPIGPLNSSYASNGNFCRGNGYGRVDRIAFHPTNANTIYAGTPYGGLWRSGNGGTNWACLTNSLPGIGVGGMVIDHSDPSTIYVLSGNGDNTLTGLVGRKGYFNASDGIYKSENAGATWQLNFSFADPTNRPRRMKQHPSDADVIFALTSNGVFRTQDGGVEWFNILAGDFVDIEFHPTDHDTVYLSGFSDFRYSYNQGDTWSTTTGITFCGRRAEIAVTPDSPDRVWLVTGPGNSPDTINSYCGIYRSINSGQSFSAASFAPDILATSSADQSNYDLGIAVDPSDWTNLLAGAIGLWRNTNAGAGTNFWTNVGPVWESTGSQQFTFPSNYVHADIHDIAFNPLDNKAYVCSDGGVYVSSDGGVTWTNITQGIISGQIYKINGSLTNEGRLGIGLQDNGAKFRGNSANQHFFHINSGDGYEVIVDPNDDDVVCASINSNLYVYDTYLNSSRSIITQGATQFFMPVRYKADDSDILFYGDSVLTVHTISTGTETTIANSMATWAIETCIDNPNRVYFAGGLNDYRNDPNGSFYTSFDAGQSASNRINTPGFPGTLQVITDIATYPNQCSKVVFSMGGFINGAKAYYSTSSGGSWQNISYNLPNVPVHSIAIDADGYFYAGTEIGVFVKSEFATEWTPFYNGMPTVPVSGLVVQESTGKLIASTFGRGVWETQLAFSCFPTRVVSGNLSGERYYTADDLLISTAILTGGVGTNVLFSAGDRVILQQGFHAQQGNRLIADLAGCVD